jgi:hypothetical protein
MPRDLDNYHPEYPKVLELLPVNPWRKKAETKKKKGKKDDEGGRRNLRAGTTGKDMEGAKLEMTYKKEYKVYDFGNYPLLGDGKPRAGQFRLMLPCDADWGGKEDNLPPETKKDGEKEDKKKKGKK